MRYLIPRPLFELSNYLVAKFASRSGTVSLRPNTTGRQARGGRDPARQTATLQSDISHRALGCWLSFIVILLIAFFFRFYHLADHPLGIFFDPAINGLDAVRLIQRGGHVIFFPSNGGRESLFMYLLIPYIWLFGTTPFSLRALTATISLLNVAMLLGFLYDVPRFNLKLGIFPNLVSRLSSPDRLPVRLRQYRFWLATLGGLALAVSYWHVAVSRLGQRPILVPMLSVPIFWFFLKGWATGSRRWFILSGIWMGLAGYTYSAARLLPIILVVSLLPEFFLASRTNLARQRSLRTNRKQTTGLRSRAWLSSESKSRLINLSAFSLAALVIYLPMGLYHLTHPGQLTARAYSVMVWNFLDTQAEIVAEIGRNMIRVGTFFCCDGSPNPLFGWPNYPGSHLLVLPFLVIGLLGSLRYARYFFPRLVALWWLIGLIPTVIAIEAPHPLRMIVAVVPTAILIALGPIYLAQWLEIRRPRFVSGRLFAFAGLIILIPAVGSFGVYFNRWTRLQSTRGAYDYAAVAIYEAILDQTDAAAPIYLPLARVNAPSLLYYLSDPFPRQAGLAAAPAANALVISPDQHLDDPTWVRFHHGQATVLPPLSAEGQQLIREALTGSGTEPIRTADGEIIARLARLATDPVRFVEEVERPFALSFGSLSLIGATYPPVIDGLADIPLTLFWTANREMADEYEILVRLVDDNRRAWANGDARPTGWVYPTSFWRPGIDEIAARHDLVIGPDRPPPGRYWLAVSIFDPGLGRRLPLANPAGDSPDTVFLGPLKVPLAEVTSPGAAENIPPVTFGDTVQLTGFSVDQATIRPGQTIQLNLLWRALARPEVDYTIFVHLLDSDDNLVAGHDAQPLAGQYPTTIWTPDEEIMDRHTFPVPADLPQGQYRLAVGLYYLPTGKRLPLRFENGATDRDGRLTLDLALTITD